MRLGYFKDKESIVKTLKELRRSLCGYIKSDNHPCDCKYGFTFDEDNRYKHPGEHNGCPELRATIIVLENMSEETWNELARNSS